MAIETGEKLLEYDCDNITVLINEALNYILSSRDEEALLLIESALALNPNDLISQKAMKFYHCLKDGKVERPIKWNEFTMDKINQI